MNNQHETDFLGQILEAMIPMDNGLRGCIALLTELAALVVSIFFVSAILIRAFGQVAIPAVFIVVILILALYASFYVYRRLRNQSQATALNAEDESLTQLPVSLPVEVPPHSISGKLALAISIAVAVCFALLAFSATVVTTALFQSSNGDLTPSKSSFSTMMEAVFWVTFLGIPVGCLSSICLSMITLWEHKPKDNYADVSLFMSGTVLAILGFWHLLGLGLADEALPCVVDALALVVSIIVLAIYRERISKPA